MDHRPFTLLGSGGAAWGYIRAEESTAGGGSLLKVLGFPGHPKCLMSRRMLGTIFSHLYPARTKGAGPVPSSPSAGRTLPAHVHNDEMTVILFVITCYSMRKHLKEFLKLTLALEDT